MNTFIGVLCAWLVSSLALELLARRDPKRLRAAARVGLPAREPLRTHARRSLALLCVAPGLALALAGLWPAWLIWLGATTATGWGLARGLSPRPQAG